MRIVSLLIMCCAFMLLIACGKRPDAVDPPDGSDPKAFPRTYPDISTDPQGHVTR